MQPTGTCLRLANPSALHPHRVREVSPANSLRFSQLPLEFDSLTIHSRCFDIGVCKGRQYGSKSLCKDVTQQGGRLHRSASDSFQVTTWQSCLASADFV